MWKKILVVTLGLYAVFAVLVSGLFADNLKALFGMSADSLAGNTYVTRSEQFKRAPIPMVDATRDALSTFAIDVDTASYTWARQVIRLQDLPRPSTVRVEEWVNAFDYELPAPNGVPFSVQVDGASSPFDETKTLVRVALQGRNVTAMERKPAHLVFLVDVSGSMSSRDKLPLAQTALRFLAAQLGPSDTVALVTYAGATRVVLPPTSALELDDIIDGIDSLTSSGGTDMGSGMQLAYEMAVKSVRRGHTSRVIVLTDGDANIGLTSHGDMLSAVSDYVKAGVTLTTVGFGMGDYRGEALEQLADKGNGQALYVDGEATIERVFGEKLAGTLEVIAKDVKVQVAFDPSVVSSYRLLGYENRDVADADFRRDDVDAGELGAGHQVTALYEVALTSKNAPLGTVFVRGQLPDSNEVFETSEVMERSAVSRSLREAGSDLQFATAVAISADVLRGNRGRWSLEAAAALADDASNGVEARQEFAALMRVAAKLDGVRNDPLSY